MLLFKAMKNSECFGVVYRRLADLFYLYLQGSSVLQVEIAMSPDVLLTTYHTAHTL
jgi:hypothetical protein